MNWNLGAGGMDDDEIDEMDDHFSPEDRMELQDRIRKVMNSKGPAMNTRSSLFGF